MNSDSVLFKLRFLLLICIVSLASQAKDIKLLVSADGKNKEVALQNALKLAITQAYGSFISSRTDILNDELIVDEMVNLQYGNIKKYKIISETGANPVFVVVEAIVNSEKLVQFAQSKGSQADLMGDAFAMNYKLSRLNLANAKKAFEHLAKRVDSYNGKLYDYEIKVENPITYNKKCLIPVEIDCKINTNTQTFHKTVNEVSTAIGKALEKDINANNFSKEDLMFISEYLEEFANMMRVNCYALAISDNLGNTIEGKIYGYKGFRYNPPPNAPKDKIAFAGGVLEGKGIEIEKLRFVNNFRYPSAYQAYINNLKLKWPGYSERYQEYFADGIVETPYSSTRQPGGMPWFREQLFSSHLTKGEIIGKLRFILIYDMDKIGRITKITVNSKK